MFRIFRLNMFKILLKQMCVQFIEWMYKNSGYWIVKS